MTVVLLCLIALGLAVNAAARISDRLTARRIPDVSGPVTPAGPPVPAAVPPAGPETPDDFTDREYAAVHVIAEQIGRSDTAVRDLANGISLADDLRRHTSVCDVELTRALIVLIQLDNRAFRRFLPATASSVCRGALRGAVAELTSFDREMTP